MKILLLIIALQFATANAAIAHCDSLDPVVGGTYVGQTGFQQNGQIGVGGKQVNRLAVFKTRVRFDAAGFAHPTLTTSINAEDDTYTSPPVAYTVAECQARFSFDVPIDGGITLHYVLDLRVPNTRTWKANGLVGHINIPQPGWHASIPQALGISRWDP